MILHILASTFRPFINSTKIPWNYFTYIGLLLADRSQTAPCYLFLITLSMERKIAASFDFDTNCVLLINYNKL